MPPAPTLVAIVVAATPVVRRGIAAALADAGWQMHDGSSATDPSIVVWDFPAGGSSAEVARMRATAGDVPMLLLVGGATPEYLADLMAAGAAGAIDRDADEAALVQAARGVAEGRTVVNAGPRLDGSGDRPPILTRRESQVLALLCAGSTNHEIAEALVISDNTVKNHVRRLYEKLQVRSRTEAMVRATRWRLVRLDADDSMPGAPLPAGPP